jgi:putative manganese efflux pump
MPIVGFLVGTAIGTTLGRFAGYTAIAVLVLVGVLMLRPGDKEEKERERLGLLAKARGIAVWSCSARCGELVRSWGVGLAPASGSSPPAGTSLGDPTCGSSGAGAVPV